MPRVNLNSDPGLRKFFIAQGDYVDLCANMCWCDVVVLYPEATLLEHPPYEDNEIECYVECYDCGIMLGEGDN